MNGRPTTPDLEALLLHRDFVRRLAVSLVRDRSAADDVEQETWLAGLRRPVGAARVRAWLGSVVRRLAARARRGTARRERREEAAARPEAAVPSAGDVFEREAVRRRVIEVVLGLDEPHRDALLLRYFEGLPPRAIARRLGLPVATVKTRLKRGLAAARARLDREHDGDRRAWMVLLLPVAGLPPAAPLVPLFGVVAMKLGTKVAVGVTLAALVTLPWWMPRGREERPPAAPLVAGRAVSPPAVAQASPLPAPERAQTGGAAPVAASKRSPRREDGPEDDREFTLIGRVVDAGTKLPVEGARVEVGWAPGQGSRERGPDLTTGSDGGFRAERLRLHRMGDHLRVVAPDRAPAFHWLSVRVVSGPGLDVVDIGSMPLSRGNRGCGRGAGGST